MDLIGIPIRITIGKKLVDNLVEFKLRKETDSQDVKIDEVVEKILDTIKKEM